jgi:hypothetical protein
MTCAVRSPTHQKQTTLPARTRPGYLLHGRHFRVCSGLV